MQQVVDKFNCLGLSAVFLNVLDKYSFNVSIWPSLTRCSNHRVRRWTHDSERDYGITLSVSPEYSHGIDIEPSVTDD